MNVKWALCMAMVISCELEHKVYGYILGYHLDLMNYYIEGITVD